MFTGAYTLHYTLYINNIQLNIIAPKVPLHHVTLFTRQTTPTSIIVSLYSTQLHPLLPSPLSGWLVLVQNSKTWYVRRSGVARSFTWLIVAIWSFVVSSHCAHLLFCDPKRVMLAPLHTHKEPPSSNCHFERVARGRCAFSCALCYY
jgi:hypothetical protein